MKKFVLGLGAQKCGTSWLYDYFSKRDDFFDGFMKEYHIFDAENRGKIFDRFLRKSIGSLVSENPKNWSKDKQLLRLSMFINIQNYYNYFFDNLKDKKKIFTDDITPTYSTLSPRILKNIKSNFEKRDIEVIPVFLMRDPVNRLRSQAKMKLRNPRKKATKSEELAEMRRLVGTREDNIRVDYSSTHDSIKKVFGEKSFFCLYEELFSNEQIKKLCNLIDIPFVKPDFAFRVNESKSKNNITKEDLMKFTPSYKKQYEFAIDLFGKEKIEEKWQNFNENFS